MRDIPKSTPKLKPPRQLGSHFRRRAFGEMSSKDTAFTLIRRPLTWRDVEGNIGEFGAKIEGIVGNYWAVQLEQKGEEVKGFCYFEAMNKTMQQEKA